VSFGTHARPAPCAPRRPGNRPRRRPPAAAQETLRFIRRWKGLRPVSSAHCIQRRLTTTVSSKGACGPGVARLWSAEKRRAAGRTRAEGHACFVN